MISVVAVGHEREERRVISGNLVSTLVDILDRVWSRNPVKTGREIHNVIGATRDVDALSDLMALRPLTDRNVYCSSRDIHTLILPEKKSRLCRVLRKTRHRY